MGNFSSGVGGVVELIVGWGLKSLKLFINCSDKLYIRIDIFPKDIFIPSLTRAANRDS